MMTSLFKKYRFILLLSLIYFGLLVLGIKRTSIWSDEAFSAFVSDHSTLSSTLSALLAGDSSDLQMIGYYAYLHFWVLLFGSSEWMLRLSNIPFLALWSACLVGISVRIFRSKTAWIAPALLPFADYYAGEARAYAGLMALGLFGISGVLAMAKEPDRKARSKIALLIFMILIIGTIYHMLMLLAALPMMVLHFRLCCDGDNALSRLAKFWSDWKLAFRWMIVPALALILYLGFTFSRGTHYDYPRPGVRQAISVLAEVSGLSMFGPNRKYSLDFRPFLIWTVPAVVCAIAVLLLLIRMVRVVRNDRYASALLLASVVALVQVLALSLLTQEQVDARHLASVIPFPLVLWMAVWTSALASGQSRNMIPAGVLLAALWFVADYRMLFCGEYDRENFKEAVNEILKSAPVERAAVVVVGDPLASAYYGLGVNGVRPCFPLPFSCQTSLSEVKWHAKYPAIWATFWNRKQIDDWLNAKTGRQEVILLISTSRDKMYRNSAWWEAVNSRVVAPPMEIHGFKIFRFS